MKRDEIDYLARLALAASGQAVDPDKPYLIESRLAPVARREGFGSIRELINAIRNRRDEHLATAVVESLASSETAFFRDRSPFLRLSGEVLPALARARAGAPIRIWSAGCGTGQEAYSIALSVRAARETIGEAPVQILGSDMSRRALEKARSGLYTHFEAQRGLPIRMLLRAFERQDDSWRAALWLREMIEWRQVNLHRDFSALGEFDVIFCRNVLGAMEPAAATKLADQLNRSLAPDGVLVLGVGEDARAAGRQFRATGEGVYHRDPSSGRAAA